MRILAIETSCDDTSIAIIEPRGKKRVSFNILSSIVSSQIEIHRKWGGVYPTLAKREHQKNLIPVLKKALRKAKLLKTKEAHLTKKEEKEIRKILEREPELLKEFLKEIAKIKKPDIDKIAVTVGPGLEPCLWVGVNFAKALSLLWNLKIVPVNHIEAHLFSTFIKKPLDKFPAIALIVSGGHTQLILVKGLNNYKIIGETRDDAAGECLDKAARIMNLPYPGGPEIEKRAKLKSKTKVFLPRPMINTKDLDFSFSGLKTAVLYDYWKRKKTKDYINALCKETQQAVIDVLIRKTKKAVNAHKAKTVLMGGGVTANKELRKQMKKAIKGVRFPEDDFCTDNAAMVGIASFFKKTKKDIKAEANLRLGDFEI